MAIPDFQIAGAHLKNMAVSATGDTS